MMNITLTLDMEQLVKSQLQTGKYATVEQVKEGSFTIARSQQSAAGDESEGEKFIR